MRHEFGVIVRTINQYEEEFFSISRLAEVLSVTPKTIRRLIRIGEIRAVKISRHWRIPRLEVIEYLQARNSYNL